MDKDQLFEKASELFQSESEADDKQAFEIFKELADSGYEDANAYVGYMLIKGIGTEMDPDASFPYLKKAAEGGHTIATLYLGVCYYDGLGTEQDLSEAYYHLRVAEDGENEDAAGLLRDLEFSAEDKKMYEDIVKELEITDEIVESIKNKKEGSAGEKYILAKHYSEQVTVENNETLKDALYLARQAYNEGLDIARQLAVEICGKYAAKAMCAISEYESEYEEEPVLIDGHEPNAVEVRVFTGGAVPIYIEDFSSSEGLGAPINCDRINIVSTNGIKILSFISGNVVVGYVDAYGQSKELLNNATMSKISGYNYLAGTCVVCGFDDDYIPLDGKTAYALAKYLDDFDVYDDGRFFEAINAYM